MRQKRGTDGIIYEEETHTLTNEVPDMKKLLSLIVVFALLLSTSVIFANAAYSTDYFYIEPAPGVVGAETYGFRNPDGWDEVYVYARLGWAGDVENAPWPGVKLKPSWVAGYGEIYTYSFASGYFRDLIFNDGKTPVNPYNQFKDHIYEMINRPTDEPFVDSDIFLTPENSTYKELYHHFGGNKEFPEYVLIELAADEEKQVPCVSVFGNYLMRDLSSTFPFAHRYAVYLPMKDSLMSLPDAYNLGVEGIEECISFCGGVELIGDMNKDGKLTVSDATFIQKQLAGLLNDPFDTLENYKIGDKELPLGFKSDVDRDGKRTIKDATAVQKQIADMPADTEEREIPFYMIDEFRVDYAGVDHTITVCNTREKAEQVYEPFKKGFFTAPFLSEALDDAFFRNYSLVITTNMVGGSCCSHMIDKLTVEGDVLAVYRYVFRANNPTPDMNVVANVIAVKKTDIENVKSFIDIEN